MLKVKAGLSKREKLTIQHFQMNWRGDTPSYNNIAATLEMGTKIKPKKRKRKRNLLMDSLTPNELI